MSFGIILSILFMLIIPIKATSSSSIITESLFVTMEINPPTPKINDTVQFTIFPKEIIQNLSSNDILWYFRPKNGQYFELFAIGFSPIVWVKGLEFQGYYNLTVRLTKTQHLHDVKFISLYSPLKVNMLLHGFPLPTDDSPELTVSLLPGEFVSFTCAFEGMPMDVNFITPTDSVCLETNVRENEEGIILMDNINCTFVPGMFACKGENDYGQTFAWLLLKIPNNYQNENHFTEINQLKEISKEKEKSIVMTTKSSNGCGSTSSSSSSYANAILFLPFILSNFNRCSLLHFLS